MRNNNSLPHFLGIGAQKVGTTWLWANLREHPEVWMPPFKEIHYFSRSPAYASPNWLASEGLHSRLFGRQPRDIFWRTWLRSRVREHLRRPNLPLIRWEWRFFFGRYNDDWYASLFEPGQGKVRGEITPAYSILIGYIKNKHDQRVRSYFKDRPSDLLILDITNKDTRPLTRLVEFMERVGLIGIPQTNRNDRPYSPAWKR